MIGFLLTLLCKISLNYKPYSVIADLHTSQFTVAHALGFSVFTSRCLVADLNSGTNTSNHYKVFLPFPAAANSEDSTQFSSDWTLHGNSTTSSPISVLHGTNMYSTTHLNLFPLVFTIRFLAMDL
jgi:hypothetical protein